MKFHVPLFLLFILSNTFVAGNTIRVQQGGKINTLKAAIQRARNGDTIVVEAGEYTSINTIINKSVVVLGKDNPVLNAHYKDEVLTILANNVTLSGLVIKNSKTGAMRDYAGIRLHKVQNVTVSNNILLNNFFGIYLSDSKHITIKNNTCKGAFGQRESGNGIHLWKSTHVSILNNTVTGHRDGIYFEFVKNALIEGNKSIKNFRYGLHFMFSDDDVYRKNTFKNNGSGVAVMYSKRIKMEHNLFEENWGSSIYGILLKDINNCSITGNRFIRNTTAIYMEGCEGIKVSGNTFNNNGWGLRVLANCINNEFKGNNFTSNSFDVTTNGSLSNNTFAKNYWDKYEGYDLDKNGTGDIPYRPVSLYSQLMEQIPQSVMLMRSFIVNLLDKVERSIPSLTPESVKDEQPEMKPWKI